MEPPPAPMVVISIIGVRITRPKSIVVCAASDALPSTTSDTSKRGAAEIAGDDVVEAGRRARWPPPR